MKILIIIPKYNFSIKEDYNYNFPLGLAYISSIIKKTQKHHVDCLNLNHHKGTIDELINWKLNKEKYDLVCTGGNALIYSALKKISFLVHNRPNPPLVIIGGPAITGEPKLMFELINPDIAVIGEGEITILELLKCIEMKGSFAKIEGIIWRNKENKISINESRNPISNIESIPLPDFEGMEFGKYLDNARCNYSWTNQTFDYPRPYPLLGSRGCPFNCTFCWHPERYRARSIKDIIRELKIMVPLYRINIITIYDDCFSADKNRLYEFCREIKNLSKKVGWEIKWSCQLLVNSVDEEMLNFMRNSGCDSISYGFESFSPVVLKSMRKPITPERIDKTLKATLKANIGIQGNFIFGDIAETKETARETLSYWAGSAQAQQISLGFVQPYPGSELYNHCLREGIIKDKIHYIQTQMGPDTIMNMTKEMSDEQIHNLNIKLLDMFRKHFNFVSPRNLHRMSQKNIYEFDFKCPFCRQITHYKNCSIENKLTYGFHLICRKCHMRSVLTGPVKKLAYKHYTHTRKLRNIYVRLKKILKQKRI